MANINKQELDELLKTKGEIRGLVFHTDASYVLARNGESGLVKLENTIKELGYPIDYRHPKRTDWYPIGLRVISLLVIKDTFGWNDEDIKEMGFNAPIFSFLVKIFMKFFISLAKTAKESPKLWKEHYRNVGKLVPVKVDEDKKFFILRLEEFKIHPIFCTYLNGYFKRVASFGITSKKIDCKETKCVFKGDPYDEFLITWE